MVVTAPATDTDISTDAQNSTTTSVNRPTHEAAKRSQQKTREYDTLLLT